MVAVVGAHVAVERDGLCLTTGGVRQIGGGAQMKHAVRIHAIDRQR
jgi:hypothetical protein